MNVRLRLLTAAFACAYLGVHVRALPQSLEDIDTINFALGVESFDVVAHRPHPPGYPVFVVMGRLSTCLLAVIAPDWDRTTRAAVGLALWGVLAGTVFAWILMAFWRTLRWPPWIAWLAAVLAITTPLFWFTSARPLSDAPALVAAVGVQCLLLRGWTVLRATGSMRMAGLVWPCLAAGLLIGLRTQTMWLSGPLIAMILLERARARDWRTTTWLLTASAAGSLVWAVPLVLSVGGLDAYVAALTAQGEEDFGEVRMVATTLDPDVLAEAAFQTFVAPWRVEWLGESMMVLAVAGLTRLAYFDRAGLGLLSVACAPYLVFTLLFQDSDMARYALPVVVPMTGLAALTLSMLPRAAAGIVAAAMLVASVWAAQEVLHAYGEDVPPAFVALREARRVAAASPGDTPVVVTHDGMRRVADWLRPEWPALPTMRPREREWLRVVEHFRSGRRDHVWFMTDIRRSDVVLFDPRARTLMGEYLHEREIREFVARKRPDEVRWWQIAEPGWMLATGWALSPEVAGITAADHREPQETPAIGYLRRADTTHNLLIGGRYLGDGEEGVVTVEIDGRPVTGWDVSPREPWFVRWITLTPRELAGEGPYAELVVRVTSGAASSSQAPRVGLEQFDFASTHSAIAGFASGWYEPEADTVSGRSWRWTSAKATIDIAGEGPAQLLLSGEGTRRYFQRPSTVVITVDGQRVRQFAAGEDFRETIDLRPGPGTRRHVVVETDQVFVPSERGESPDERTLGLRMFEARIVPR